MGCWGTGIFDDDLAVDIRDLYDEMICKNDSDNMTTNIVLKLFDESEKDEDDSIVVYSALASIQLNRSCLMREIRDKTINLIESNSGIRRWEEAGEKACKERLNELYKLRNILIKAPVIQHVVELSTYNDFQLKFSVYTLTKAGKAVYVGTTAFPEKRFRYMNFISLKSDSFFQGLFRNKKSKEQEFWEWFSVNEVQLFEAKNDQDVIIMELASRLKKINKGLTFELGGILNGKRIFAISADGVKAVFPFVIKLFNEPKLLTKWIVVPFRQRLKSIERMKIKFGDISIDCSDIFFVAKQEESLISLDIYVKGIEDITSNVANAIYIILDSAIGEYDVETKVGRVNFLPGSNLKNVENAMSLIKLPEKINEMK